MLLFVLLNGIPHKGVLKWYPLLIHRVLIDPDEVADLLDPFQEYPLPLILCIDLGNVLAHVLSVLRGAFGRIIGNGIAVLEACHGVLVLHEDR